MHGFEALYQSSPDSVTLFQSFNSFLLSFWGCLPLLVFGRNQSRPRPNWNAPPGPTHTPRSLRFQTTAAWLWPTVAKLLRLRFSKKKHPRKRKITSAQREEPPPSRSLAPPRGPLLREATDTNFAKLQRSSNAPHELEFSTNLQNLLFSLPDPNFFTLHAKRSHGRNAGFPGLTAVPHFKLSSLCTLTTTDEIF